MAVSINRLPVAGKVGIGALFCVLLAAAYYVVLHNEVAAKIDKERARTGELETDLVRLLDDYDLRDAAALVEAKRAGERTAADPALLDAWRPRLAGLLDRLDEA